jgi:tRNA (cmo5U34)-methyltransferase
MANLPKAGNFDEKPPMNVEEYDKFIRLFCGAYEEMFKLTHCYLRAILPEQARIPVAGVGTGMEILEFAPLNAGWSFCGVDPSADMLALTEKKISKRNLVGKLDRSFPLPQF